MRAKVAATVLLVMGVPFVTAGAALHAAAPSLVTQVTALQTDVKKLKSDVAQLQKVKPLRGATGSTGARGAAGPRGATGDQGLRGPQGPAGPQGLTGAAGPQGPQGLQGPSGAVGLQGLAGPAGPPGAVGATGATGPIGPAGPAGAAAPTMIPSGQSMSGDVALGFTANDAGDKSGTVINFRLPLAAAPQFVILGPQGGCSGPGVAPAQVLCLYPSRQAVNVGAVQVYPNDSPNPALLSADRFGFYFQLTATSPGFAIWQGSYTYTAP